jgi:TLC domain
MKKYDKVFLHDMFNILSLIVIVYHDVQYLYLTTIWDHIGTLELGREQRDLASTLFFLFFIYIVVDTLWIAIIPSCVLSSPMALIVHHLFTFLFLLIPYYVAQFHWHGAISIFVEVNVLFLVSRRQFSQSTLMYRILDAVFLLTWFTFRLVVFPFLFFFYSYEYVRYSEQLEGKWRWANIVLLAPALQVMYMFCVIVIPTSILIAISISILPSISISISVLLSCILREQIMLSTIWHLHLVFNTGPRNIHSCSPYSNCYCATPFYLMFNEKSHFIFTFSFSSILFFRE